LALLNTCANKTLETMNKTSKHLDYDKAKLKGHELIAQGDQLGLFILIALETGLRCGDILKLNKQDFFSEDSKYFIRFIALKTKKEDVRPISKTSFLTAYTAIDDRIFYNEKYGCQYSNTWANRGLKRVFKQEDLKAQNQSLNISAHSLRKSIGLKVYESAGLETARAFLQHDSYDTTKVYLNITKTELNEKLSDILGL
jgi:integrase